MNASPALPIASRFETGVAIEKSFLCCLAARIRSLVQKAARFREQRLLDCPLKLA